MSINPSAVTVARIRRVWASLAVIRVLTIGAVLLLHLPAQAADPDSVLLSFDVPGSAGALQVRGRDVFSMQLSGGGLPVVSNLGDLLPRGADVDAVSIPPEGGLVFSTASSFSVSGVDAADEDLLLFRDGVISVVFDGSVEGLPETADIDAVHVVSLVPLEIYYSVEHPTSIGGVVYSDNDILRYDGSVHTRHVEGQTMLGAGERRANIDGLWVDPGQAEFIVSLDVSVAGISAVVTADDEDLLEWSSATLKVLVDSSLYSVPSRGIDVDALHLQNGLFSDGFESGDVSMWSASTS